MSEPFDPPHVSASFVPPEPDTTLDRLPLREDLWDAISLRLGEAQRARNIFDHTDEATTVITLVDYPVEDLARFITDGLADWIVKHDTDLLAPIRALVEEAASLRGQGADEWMRAHNAGVLNFAGAIDKAISAVVDTPAPLAVPDKCPTPGCSGDPRYGAPGRGHHEGCRYPIDTDAQADGGEGA